MNTKNQFYIYCTRQHYQQLLLLLLLLLFFSNSIVIRIIEQFNRIPIYYRKTINLWNSNYQFVSRDATKTINNNEGGQEEDGWRNIEL